MLRDKFAMAAMQGMVSTIDNQRELDRLRSWAKQNDMTLSEFIAADSYKQADAMMREREKWDFSNDPDNIDGHPDGYDAEWRNDMRKQRTRDKPVPPEVSRPEVDTDYPYQNYKP